MKQIEWQFNEGDTIRPFGMERTQETSETLVAENCGVYCRHEDRAFGSDGYTRALIQTPKGVWMSSPLPERTA